MSNNDEIRRAYHVDWNCAWITALTSGMSVIGSIYIMEAMYPALVLWGTLISILGLVFAMANLLVSIHCAQEAGQLEPILKGRLDGRQS